MSYCKYGGVWVLAVIVFFYWYAKKEKWPCIFNSFMPTNGNFFLLKTLGGLFSVLIMTLNFVFGNLINIFTFTIKLKCNSYCWCFIFAVHSFYCIAIVHFSVKRLNCRCFLSRYVHYALTVHYSHSRPNCFHCCFFFNVNGNKMKTDSL